MDGPPPPDDIKRTTEELMESYVDGRVEAFDELYRRLSPNLMSYLLRITGDQTQAEELLQSTFSKIHRGRRNYLRKTPVLPWVIAIARRTFLDNPRARGRTGKSRHLSGWSGHLLGQVSASSREAIELTRAAGLTAFEAGLVLGASEETIRELVEQGYQELRAARERKARE